MKHRTGLAVALWLALAGCVVEPRTRRDERNDGALGDRSGRAGAPSALAARGVSPAAASAVSSLGVLTLEQAIRIALAKQPSLRVADHRREAAGARASQAGAYPNPRLAFEGEGLGASSGAGGETSYTVEQEIVLGDRLRRAHEVADADRLASEARHDAEEFAVASRVTRAYFGAVAALERLGCREDLSDLSARIAAAVGAQVDAGAAIEPDRLRAEVVAEQARLELEAASLEAASSRRALASAMGLDETIWVPLTTPLSELPALPGEEQLAAATLNANGRIELARLAIERARRSHELARAEAMPSLQAFIGPRYSDADGEATLDLGLSIEVPVFDRNRGEIRAALADRLAAAADLRAVQLELLSEVAAAWASYETARVAVVRYRGDFLARAERTLELTQRSYERGKTDYLRLLDAQQVVIASRVASIDAMWRMQEAAAVLRELARLDAPWREPQSGGAVVKEMNP